MSQTPPAGSRNGGMDVLRALAIVAVVNCHAVLRLADPAPAGSVAESRTRLVAGLGGRGVDLFFGLSGWLLGRQLLREYLDTGRIDFGRFWLRRWLRTLPAYYAVLLATTLWYCRRTGEPPDWTYPVFLQTYCSGMPYYGVSWSLCVEEHFYLAVPLLTLLVAARWGRLALVAVLVAPEVCRQLGCYGSVEQTHVRYDQCGAGVLLAYASLRWPAVWATLTRHAAWVGGAAVLAVAWCAAGHAGFGPYFDIPTLGWSLVSACLILVANTRTWAANLHLRPTRFLAERAYSLYLLHGEGIAVARKLPDLPPGARVALTWAVSLVLAEALYRLVELPGMSLRGRIGGSRRDLTPPAPLSDTERGENPSGRVASENPPLLETASQAHPPLRVGEGGRGGEVSAAGG